uniref:PPM-type phosphatase domain-containing protein n=1 Tax=Meloidogyne hapla TaxID=6305 RepID=A0A1I8B0E8_MELHA
MENMDINLLSSKKRLKDDMNGSDIPSSEFQISAASAQGGRKYMEDRISVEVGRDVNGRLDYIFAAIYDGHGGPQASEYACQNLLDNVIGNQAFFSDDDQQILGAIREGFLQTHFDMQKVAKMWPPTVSGFPCTAGTTATVAFIRNGKLYTGHVGDSSIILANFDEAAAGFNDAKLTEDHKPEKHSERERIEKAGGAVATKAGIVRVIWKRPVRGHRGPVRRSTSTESIPFLAVARSLGDFWSLNPENNQFVVSPEPDVDVFRLKSSDNFVVLCSDGLSNVVTFRSIVQILNDVEKRNQSHSINHSHYLLQNALNKWGGLRADNISIICIKLNADQIPSDHPDVVESGVDVDVSKQLTEHPYAMFQVSTDNTFRLKSETIPHFFDGVFDKGMNSSRKSNQVIFSGPGFVVPEINNHLMDNAIETVSASSVCGSEPGQNGHDYGESSDVEEVKHQSSEAKGLEKEVNEEPTKDVEIGQQMQKSITPPPLLESTKPELNEYKRSTYLDTIRQQIAESSNARKSILSTMSTSRVGIKRRRTENEETDGFNRDTSSLYLLPSSSSNKRVYFEERTEDIANEATGPPPAKRSRLQSVLNFFSKFLKW